MNGGPAPKWDRFAHWPRFPAMLLLAVMAGLLSLSAWLPVLHTSGPATPPAFVSGHAAPERPRDDDLTLYDRVTERIRHGEQYYAIIVEEHRRIGFPVRPGLAVRLPMLAYFNAWAGESGQAVAAVLLALAVLIAWWRRLGEEPGGLEHRAMALALLVVGASLGLNRYFFALHELWSGMLLALSFALHRPDRGAGGKWGASLAVAALALAIREHALPFVLLMAAMAFWRRQWKEGAAWSGLALIFLVALVVHLGIIVRQVQPGDVLSAPWLVMRGLTGWISNITLSSNLRYLPHWLAGPLVLLMVFGWAGWRTSAGSFATFLYLGYGLFFMLAGRDENYYWGAMVAPAMFIGLAFAPRWLRSLWRAAVAK